MNNKLELFKYFEFMQEDRYLKRFLSLILGTFVCSVLLFLIYARVIDPPRDETIRGLLVTIVITPLITVPFAAHALRLEYRLSKAQRHLERLVREDPLTHLLNRRGFYEQISIPQVKTGQIWMPFQSNDSIKVKHGALLILDIDNFKRINDSYGHDVGDLVLTRLAEVLAEVVRQGDVVARIGGEEFAIFLKDANVNNVIAIFDRIRSMLENMSVYSSCDDVFISVSGGATLAFTGAEFNLIYKSADAMLFKAKRSGKNCMFIENYAYGEKQGCLH